VRKTVQAVAVRYDAFALHIIQNCPNLLGRKFVMIEEGNEFGDGALEIDVIFPEGVIGVDEESLGEQSLTS
jgi:hypothetical protein